MELLDTPERALVVAPHPDDAEFGCAGTVARWVRQGAEVYLVLCTDGRAGTTDVETPPERLAAIREKEQEAAAQLVGVREVVYLRHPDGALAESRPLLGQLVRAIRRFRPDVVLTSDPYRLNGHQHQDHRAAGRASMDACFPYARDPWHFPEHLQQEGLGPHKAVAVLFWGADDPQVFGDITDTIDLKVLSLQAHRSQMGGRRMSGVVRQRAQEAGERAGCLYAEGFRRITFRR
jgi:LmbE family N-acetylglucosaminyl deacetylase